MSQIVAVQSVQGEARADSRDLAERMGNKHKNVLSLIEDYANEFAPFGALAFETEVRPAQGKGGIPARYALLNEDQCYFLLTLVRNNDITVAMKRELVQAFGAFRRQVAALPALPADPVLAQLQAMMQIRAAQLVTEQQVAAQGQQIQAFRAELDQSPIQGQQVSTIYKLGQQLGQRMGGYALAWRVFKNHFNLASYRDLPRSQFDAGVRFLQLQISSYGGEGDLGMVEQ